MIVLYEQGMEDTAAELAGMGFEMKPMSSRIRADAVLYISDAHAALMAHAGRKGAPLLCVRGLNSAQIASAIRKRSVHPLF